MLCPFDKVVGMREVKRDYHHLTRQLVQPMNTILSILYECPECGVRVETSQQVRVTPVKADWVKPAMIGITEQKDWLQRTYGQLPEAQELIELMEQTGDGVTVEIKKEDAVHGKENTPVPRRKKKKVKSSTKRVAKT